MLSAPHLLTPSPWLAEPGAEDGEGSLTSSTTPQATIQLGTRQATTQRIGRRGSAVLQMRKQRL